MNHLHAPALVTGSTLARALYEVWTGRPVTVVDSAPGAGKTTLLVDLCDQLLHRSDMDIVLATPTRTGARDVAQRLVKKLMQTTPNKIDRPRVLLAVSGLSMSTAAEIDNGASARTVTIRTVASCAGANPPVCDLLIFDEAYQSTYSDAMMAADRAQQVLLVGDPGQIGPVITVDTHVWEGRDEAPHRRAPEVFAARPDAITLHLGATYRLGAPTVAAISALYDFEFESARPNRYLTDPSGARVPELSHFMLDPEADTAASSQMRAVANRAVALIGTQYSETHPGGSVTTRRLKEHEIAIVVPHNNQLTGLSAILASAGHTDIVVGTADSLQGGQWPAVVAIDPLFGHAALKEFQVSPGRLCVMASRHMAALVWATVPDWRTRMGSAVEELGPEVAQGIAVREVLSATPSRN